MSTHEKLIGEKLSANLETKNSKKNISTGGQLVLILFYLLSVIGLIISTSIPK